MGKVARKKTSRLGGKLRAIRLALKVSQPKLAEMVGLSGESSTQAISDFERGKSDPPLEVVLAYSRLANVLMEVLADDSIDLPAKIPATKKERGGVPRPERPQR